MMPDHCYSCGKLVKEDQPIQHGGHLWCSDCAEAHGIRRCPDCDLVYDSTNEEHNCREEESDEGISMDKPTI